MTTKEKFLAVFKKDYNPGLAEFPTGVKRRAEVNISDKRALAICRELYKEGKIRCCGRYPDVIYQYIPLPRSPEMKRKKEWEARMKKFHSR